VPWTKSSDLRDVVVGSFELFTSRTSQQTNDLVKVLTFPNGHRGAFARPSLV
jgi:hypothetical protein